MKLSLDRIALVSTLIICFGCTYNEENTVQIPIVILDTFDTIVTLDDGILSRPSIIKFDGESNLFVYDTGHGNVLVFDKNGEVVNEIGRRGRGPGEFQWINSMLIQADEMHFVDLARRLIHQYNINGDFIKSLDAGENRSLALPPLPPLPSDISAGLDSDFHSKISNQPHVVKTGDYLIPSDRSTGFLYTLYNQNGEETLTLGDIPDGSSLVMDYGEIRNSITNEEVPTILKSSSFVVNDGTNDNEIYLVYNSIGELAKYNLTNGQKLWSKSIPMTQETEKLTQDYFNAMNGLLKLADGMSVHRKYLAGASGPNDELYLLMYNFADKQMWIHEFNGTGELVMRYRFTSEVTLLPVFDIDFEGQRFFVLTEESEIRTYHF